MTKSKRPSNGGAARKGGAPRRAQMTKREREKILRLREERGWNVGKIARKYGRCWRTIMNVLDRAKETGGDVRRLTQLKKNDRTRILAMVEEEPAVSCTALLRALKESVVTEITLRRYLKKKGYVCDGPRKKPVWRKIEDE
jgi:transposase-like protein